MMDLANSRLVDSKFNAFIPGAVKNIAYASVNPIGQTSIFAKLLAEFPEITGIDQVCVTVPGDVRHHIITHRPLVHERVRRLASLS